MTEATTTPDFDAVRFRGEYLALFASIEDVIGPAVERLVTKGKAKKPPHLFGHKFEFVRKFVQEPGVWKHPSHVAPLLEAISPFAVMRGIMCHAVIESAKSENGKGFFLVRPPGKCGWDRRTLSLEEAQKDISDLRNLADKLSRQAVAGL